MNPNERLTHFLRIALEKVERREFKKTSDALIASLPQIVNTCAVLIQEGTPAERKSAMELIAMFWNRLMRDETANRKLASRRKPKTTKAPEMSAEEFETWLTKIDDPTADKLFHILNGASRRYHGQ